MTEYFGVEDQLVDGGRRNNDKNKVVPLFIPLNTAAACRDNPERLEWLKRLPDAIDYLRQRWSLKLGSPFEEATCAWVAPAILQDTSAAVLKLGMPHMEGEHEADGLRFWAGDPTVLLMEADDALGAMLLERCEPGTSLRSLPESEQDVVIATLLRRLWRTPSKGHRFRPLLTMIKLWSSEALSQANHWHDRGLVSAGLALLERLTETTERSVLLATDLHAGNVLRARRQPWLAIDPKPFVGDPAYDATQHLLNCYDRLFERPDETISRLSALLEIECERVRLWTFARAALLAGEDWRNERWLALARAIRV